MSDSKQYPDQPSVPVSDRIALPITDAASMLSIGRTCLWELTAPRGPIPSFRIGRSVRYRVDDLRAYVDSQMKTGAAE